mgnify:FL=1
MNCRVFVDSNIFKYAASQLPRYKPQLQTKNWGGSKFEETVYDSVIVNPNDNVTNNPILRKEIELIPELVALQKNGNIEFFETIESKIETWGLPNMDSETGRLYGAKISTIEPPPEGSRSIVFGASVGIVAEQYEFLRKIESKRFSEIQKTTGAFQGKNPPNRNQLLDAFHLWCAENSGCDVFLTGEAKKLRDSMQRKKMFIYKTKVLLPSELLNSIDGRLNKKQHRTS